MSLWAIILPALSHFRQLWASLQKKEPGTKILSCKGYLTWKLIWGAIENILFITAITKALGVIDIWETACPRDGSWHCWERRQAHTGWVLRERSLVLNLESQDIVLAVRGWAPEPVLARLALCAGTFGGERWTRWSRPTCCVTVSHPERFRCLLVFS